MRRFMAVWAMGLVLAAAPVQTRAAEEELRTAAVEEPNPAVSLGWGMAAVGTNIGYIPAKMIYATAGGLVGLLAWGVTLGNDDVAMGILQPALSGTWVLTPEMLRGEQPIMFVGPSYEARSPR